MKTRECNEAEKLIVADLDEGLKPSEQERLENHLRRVRALPSGERRITRAAVCDCLRSS